MIDLSVIIVNYNTYQLLLNCLTSIFKQTSGLRYEIIVVDNGSTDGSVWKVKKLKSSRLRIINNKENCGFAKANNQALKFAKGRYCLLLNSDTEIINNALKKLVDFADSKPKLGLVGPRLLNKDGSCQPSTAPFFSLAKVFIWLFTGDRLLYRSYPITRQVDWVTGAALLVRRVVIDRVGLLDEQFFMYLEEVEWCFRIKEAGFQNWFYPGAQVYHLVRGSSTQGKQGAILGIYKGLIYFYQKHFGRIDLAVLKLALLAKAIIAYLFGRLIKDKDLADTYAKALTLVR